MVADLRNQEEYKPMTEQTKDIKAEEQNPTPEATPEAVSDTAMEQTTDDAKPATEEKKGRNKKTAPARIKPSREEKIISKRRKRKSTEYGKQLAEKQIAKEIYGLRERQFSNYYKEAFRREGDTGNTLRQLLQMRLDSVVYQAGFGKSILAARQMVSHGFFMVNGKKVNIPSYQVKIKDIISIKPSKENKKVFNEEAEEVLKNKQIPSWLAVDKKTKTIKIAAKPVDQELDQQFNPRLIVEFYSK